MFAKPGSQHYLVSVALTKTDGSPGKVQSSAFTADDPNVEFRNETFDNSTGIITAEVHSSADVSTGGHWSGDADLGEGVSPINADFGPIVFSSVDIEANSANATLGEPVDNA